jgi:hypothetical protein
MIGPFELIGYGLTSIWHGVFYSYLLWIVYGFIMNMKRARDDNKLTVTAKILGYPVLYVGLMLDVLINLTVMTAILLEAPRWGEWLVTTRLQRHAYGRGFRKAIAIWFAENVLNFLDPSGQHIKY